MKKIWVCGGSLLSLLNDYYRCYSNAHPNFPEFDSDFAFSDAMNGKIPPEGFDLTAEREKMRAKPDLEEGIQ